MRAPYLTKGMHVYVKGLVAQKAGTYSLAGAQPKVAARLVELTGCVAHVRGNDPVFPTEFGIWIVPDGPDDAKLFEGLEVEAARCEKCGVVEIGPLPPSLIGALL